MDTLKRGMIRQIQKEVCEALSKLRHERAEILSRLDPLQAAPLRQHLNASELSSGSLVLLRTVAELSENAQLELEVNRVATRKFAFQVCSPVDFAKLLTFFWPIFPDFNSSIRAL